MMESGETLLNNHWLGNRGGSFSFLVGTISNVLVMEIGWTDVGSGGYILMSYAHSNTSCYWYFYIWDCFWYFYRVFEIRRTERSRFSAGLTEASYLAVLLSAKHFFVVLYVMALPKFHVIIDFLFNRLLMQP
jgi:hypothetical protein